MEIPNPFMEHDSMKEAEEAAGFSLVVPETMNDFSKRIIRTTAAENHAAMIEVIYRSGDYTHYAENSTITVDNMEVSIKGENGRIRLATWNQGDYTYSIGFYFGKGISAEDLNGVIASVQ